MHIGKYLVCLFFKIFNKKGEIFIILCILKDVHICNKKSLVTTLHLSIYILSVHMLWSYFNKGCLYTLDFKMTLQIRGINIGVSNGQKLLLKIILCKNARQSIFPKFSILLIVCRWLILLQTFIGLTSLEGFCSFLHSFFIKCVLRVPLSFWSKVWSN